MREKEFSLASLELASNQEGSGGLWIERRKRSWRMASSTFFWSFWFLGLLVIPGLLSGQAEDEKDARLQRDNYERGIRPEIAALLSKIDRLQAAVSGLQDKVGALQTANVEFGNQVKTLETSEANLQTEVNSLQASNTTLKSELAAVQSNHALALGPFVSVNPNSEIGVAGPNITFTGANIHIVSGSGSTYDKGAPRGLGNLIIGYDEDPINALAGDAVAGLPIMQTAGSPSQLQPGDRGGSHNLIIGGGNRFTRSAFGGFVAGERNTVAGIGASVSGGYLNGANFYGSVSGGLRNTVNGVFSSVSGGLLNNSSGELSSITGGYINEADGTCATVTGGADNNASNPFDDLP
jgi:hypothetical protein